MPPPRPPEFAAPGTDRAAGFRPERRPGFVLPCKTDRGAARPQRLQRRRPRRLGAAAVEAPVRLSSIMAEGGAVSLPDRPLLACEFAAVIADYVRLNCRCRFGEAI